MEPAERKPSSAGAALDRVLQETLPRALAAGIEPGPRFLLGWDTKGMGGPLRIDRELWAPFLLLMAGRMDAEALAIHFCGWSAASPSPSEAPDRQSVLLASILERANPTIRCLGWTYSTDFSVAAGQPGHLFDIKPISMEIGTTWRTPHLEPLADLWRALKMQGSQTPGGRGPESGAAPPG